MMSVLQQTRGNDLTVRLTVVSGKAVSVALLLRTTSIESSFWFSVAFEAWRLVSLRLIPDLWIPLCAARRWAAR